MTMDMAEICKRIEYEVGGIIGHNFLSGAKLTIDYTTQNILREEPKDTENSTGQFYWIPATFTTTVLLAQDGGLRPQSWCPGRDLNSHFFSENGF